MPEELKVSVGRMELGPAGSLRRAIEQSKSAAQETIRYKRRSNVELTLKECIKWINDQDIDETVKKKLVQKVSVYPHSALIKFMESIPNQINSIQKEQREKSKKKPLQ